MRASLLSGAPRGVPTITSPVLNQVHQRNGSNQATVTVAGTTAHPCTSIQARAVSLINGSTTAWTTVGTHATPSTGSFSGTITVTGGWYKLEVQTFYFGMANGVGSLATFGVGEIFVVGGQSLTACNNQGSNTSSDPRSLMISAAGAFSKCSDPMTIQTASQGSLWPIFADLLVTAINVPVCIANTAMGGTMVSDWQPGGTNYNTYLKPTVQLFPANGFRAFLWGQGETDAGNLTSTANYQGTAGVNGLRNIISQSRTDAGWTIPWGINIESAADGVNPTVAISTAQTNVAGDANNFTGVSVDTYVNSPYRWTSFFPHLSTVGETTVATQWVTILRAHFSI